MKQLGWVRARPTGSFFALLFVLLAIWYAAASQTSATAYLLLFALGAVVVISIPHAFVNLRGVQVSAESVPPAFAGREISLRVEVSNTSRAPRHGLTARVANASNTERIDYIAPGKAVRLLLRFQA